MTDVLNQTLNQLPSVFQTLLRSQQAERDRQESARRYNVQTEARKESSENEFLRLLQQIEDPEVRAASLGATDMETKGGRRRKIALERATTAQTRQKNLLKADAVADKRIQELTDIMKLAQTGVSQGILEAEDIYMQALGELGGLLGVSQTPTIDIADNPLGLEFGEPVQRAGFNLPFERGVPGRNLLELLNAGR